MQLVPEHRKRGSTLSHRKWSRKLIVSLEQALASGVPGNERRRTDEEQESDFIAWMVEKMGELGYSLKLGMEVSDQDGEGG